MAVEVPDEIKTAIEDDVVAALRPVVPGARWTPPQGRHITLAFLGEVDEGRVEPIAGAVRRAVSRHAAFETDLSRIGGFPSLRRPRVLWIGVGEGAQAIGAVARAVAGALEPLGFRAEDRAFNAHLTLARIPAPRAFTAQPPALPNCRFVVDEVVLFRSQLHPKGARYTPLERFGLGS